MRGHGSGSGSLIVDLFRLRLTRVHGVGETLPCSATRGAVAVADIQLGATAGIQDEQIGSSATVAGPLGFPSILLPLVKVLSAGRNGRIGCLKNPRAWVRTIRLGPQHPRALGGGRGRDGEQAAAHGD